MTSAPALLGRRILPSLPTKNTVRLRLTALYTGLFVLSGAVLLAITYVLFEQLNGPRRQPTTAHGTISSSITHVDLPLLGQMGTAQRAADGHQLLIDSGIALAVVALLALLLGWLVAGRVLRPIRIMTATTQHISEDNLHQRLALSGPRDELKHLADTIDGLLARLEDAFQAQGNFVANASHELRTPLTLTRAVVQMTLRDHSATIDSYRTTCEEVLAAADQQEQLIESLLTLARSQRGLDHREPIDLETLATEATDDYLPEAASRNLSLEVTCSPAVTAGDPHLVEQVVANLLENALRYNQPDGRVWITVHNSDGQPTLQIENTGPQVPPDQVPRLLQPFQRSATNRTEQHDGYGLGLAIVAAIAHSHDATLTVTPRSQGGLSVQVAFPPSRAPTRLPVDTQRPHRARRLNKTPRPPTADQPDPADELATG